MPYCYTCIRGLHKFWRPLDEKRGKLRSLYFCVMGERAKPRPFLTLPNRTSLECNHSILELRRFHFRDGLRITSGNGDVPESPIALIKVLTLQVVFLNILVEIVLLDQNLRFLSFLIFNF